MPYIANVIVFIIRRLRIVLVGIETMSTIKCWDVTTLFGVFLKTNISIA